MLFSILHLIQAFIHQRTQQRLLGSPHIAGTDNAMSSRAENAPQLEAVPMTEDHADKDILGGSTGPREPRGTKRLFGEERSQSAGLAYTNLQSPPSNPPDLPSKPGQSTIPPDLLTPTNPSPSRGTLSYACDDCGRTFSTRRDLTRHLRIQHSRYPFPYDLCHKSFTRRVHLRHHKWLYHGEDGLFTNHLPMRLYSYN